MKKLLLLLALASPLPAQVSQASFDSLRAEVLKLRREVGPYGDSIPPSSGFAVSCPELPNGRYSVWCRVQQIGTGIDANNTTVAGFQSQISGLATRLAASEAKVATLTAGPSGPIIAPTAEGGNLYVPGKLIVGGGCPPDASAAVQICGPGGVSIFMASNLAGAWYQSPAAHVAEWALSGDGGMRLMQNGYGTRQCFDAVDPTNGVHYQKCFKENVDPSKPYGLAGFDSQAQWSFLRVAPCQIAGTDGCTTRDYTQDVVLSLDPVAKTISLDSWQRGWTWQIRSSTCPRCFDRVTTIQPQQ